MKKTLIIALLTLLVGCNTKDLSDPKIATPSNNSNPLNWVWVIERELHPTDGATQGLVGKYVEFSKNYLLYNDSVLYSPTYQVRKVNYYDYTLHTGKSFLSDYIKDSNDIQVITILDGQLFFCEVIIINTNNAILKISNKTYLLKKTKKATLDLNLKDKENLQNPQPSPTDDSMAKDTGLLLGLRSKMGDSYSYRTVWISNTNNQIETIDIPGILFPRRSGFWIVEWDDLGQNQLSARQIDRIKEETTLQWIEEPKEDEGNHYKVVLMIDYVGNDYMAVRRKYIDKNNVLMENQVSIIPVDTLPELRGIALVELLGNQGEAILKNSKERFWDSLKIKDVVLKDNPHKENLGLSRNMGQWVLTSMLSYQKGDELLWETFKINALVPKTLVNYDKMHLSWSQIKNKIPSALDVFTSPQNNMAVIITENEAFIYTVKNGDLGDYPISSVPLKDNEVIVMSEWATGNYVDKWSQELQDQQSK